MRNNGGYIRTPLGVHNDQNQDRARQASSTASTRLQKRARLLSSSKPWKASSPAPQNDLPNDFHSEAQEIREDVNSNKYIKNWSLKSFGVSDIPNLLSAAFSADQLKQLYGLFGLKEILSSDLSAPVIQKLFDANLISLLSEILADDTKPYLQAEAVSLLAYMGCGTSKQIKQVFRTQTVPILAALLRSKHSELAEQAIIALSDVAQSSKACSNLLLKLGVLSPLLLTINNTNNIDILKDGMWTLYTILNSTNFVSSSAVIPTIIKTIDTQTDPEILSHTFWTLALFHKHKSSMKKFAALNGIHSLIKHLDDYDTDAHLSCLRTIRVILAHDEDKEEANLLMKDPEFLSKLFHLLKFADKFAAKEIFQVLNALTKGAVQNIENIVNNHEYIEALVQISVSGHKYIREDATNVLLSIIKKSSIISLQSLIQSGVLDRLIETFASSETNQVGLSIEVISTILGYEIDQNNKIDDAENILCKIRRQVTSDLMYNLQSQRDCKVIDEVRSIIYYHNMCEVKNV